MSIHGDADPTVPYNHSVRLQDALQKAGYPVNPWSGRNLYFGGVAAVERRPGGVLAAAGDPRRGGHGIADQRAPA